MRRAPFVVLYWRGERVLACNYATGRTVALQPPAWRILEYASKWTRASDLEHDCAGWPADVVHDTIDRLLEDTLLDSTSRRAPRTQHLLARWGGWNPAAALFHLMTKNRGFRSLRPVQPPLAFSQSIVPHVHRFAGRPTVELPDFHSDDPLTSTLLARRTWRHFGTAPLTLNQLSDLLGLTFGIQSWMELDGERVPLRTAPSGGARHSLEAYVVALAVDGLEAGAYHYCPGTHALTRLEGRADRHSVAPFFPDDAGFDRAAALIFVTSVFGRVQRKYDTARAYRVVLLEAGHFCQSFCLVATSAGLAPFCTAAFADHLVEQLLGMDGVSESVVYAMGVGTRPEGVAWAPWADGAAAPQLSPPEHALRFGR